MKQKYANLSYYLSIFLLISSALAIINCAPFSNRDKINNKTLKYENQIDFENVCSTIYFNAKSFSTHLNEDDILNKYKTCLEEHPTGGILPQGDVLIGDMIMSKEKNIGDSSDHFRLATSSGTLFWPEGVVPYFFDSESFSKLENPEEHKKTIREGCKPWAEAANITCLEIDEPDFSLDFQPAGGIVRISANPGGCNARVGYSPNRISEMNMAPSWCNQIWIAVHEWGHILGFYHEHQREDRDEYVVISDDVPSAWTPAYSNFGFKGIGDYDPRSTMHYRNHFLLKTEKGPIKYDFFGIPEGLESCSRNCTGISKGDREAVIKIYGPASSRRNIRPVCGSAHGRSLYPAPLQSQLCARGFFSEFEESSNRYSWKCLGLISFFSRNCYAKKAESISGIPSIPDGNFFINSEERVRVNVQHGLPGSSVKIIEPTGEPIIEIPSNEIEFLKISSSENIWELKFPIPETILERHYFNSSRRQPTAQPYQLQITSPSGASSEICTNGSTNPPLCNKCPYNLSFIEFTRECPEINFDKKHQLKISVNPEINYTGPTLITVLDSMTVEIWDLRARTRTNPIDTIVGGNCPKGEWFNPWMIPSPGNYITEKVTESCTIEFNTTYGPVGKNDPLPETDPNPSKDRNPNLSDSPLLFYSGNSDSLYHQTGKAGSDGSTWFATVLDQKNKFLNYGPYVRLDSGVYQVDFELRLDIVHWMNNGLRTQNDHILTLDVVRSKGNELIAKKEIRRHDFDDDLSYKKFRINFHLHQNTPSVEFRSFYHGKSYVELKSISVKK